MDDGIVELYSKNMDLNNMKGLFLFYGGMFGDIVILFDGFIFLEVM